MRLLAKDCDIEYVDPSAYTPPDLEDGLPKNGFDEDPYEKLVRGNLQLIDQQKVFFAQLFLRGFTFSLKVRISDPSGMEAI